MKDFSLINNDSRLEFARFRNKKENKMNITFTESKVDYITKIIKNALTEEILAYLVKDSGTGKFGLVPKKKVRFEADELHEIVDFIDRLNDVDPYLLY